MIGAIIKTLAVLVLAAPFLMALAKFSEAIRLDLPRRLAMLHLYETGLTMLVLFACMVYIVSV